MHPLNFTKSIKVSRANWNWLIRFFDFTSKQHLYYDDIKNCDDYLHHATYFYNALGGDGDEKKNEDEIIKNVLKEVTIDKESGNN